MNYQAIRDKFASLAGKPKPRTPEDGSLNIRRLTLAGLTILVLFFGAFGGWAALAPLDSAVLAQGFIKVSGEQKVIQHLEGGIVDRLLVDEGDVVRADQILVTLDEEQPRSRLDLINGRRLNRMALVARLMAERDGKAEIEFPEELIKDAHPAAADAMSSQRDLFQARLRALEGYTAILHKRILQTGNEVEGLEALVAAKDSLVRTLNEEATDLESLFAKGLTTRERHLALRRKQAEVEGERASNQASISRARNTIAELEQQILELSTKRLNEAVSELAVAEAELFDLEQQKRSAADVLNRLVIRAPVDGVVIGLKVHTRGGVVRAGDALLSLVPAGKDLVVEARIRPEDINSVAEGQPVQVRISAFAHLGMLPLNGSVQIVSADRTVDERTGTPYFTAVVGLDPAEQPKLEGHKILPGMTADVSIRTGARTMVGYLTEPLSRTMSRAMRE